MHGSQITESWINDGTNSFANGIVAGNAIGSTTGSTSINATAMSPVNYANAAVVTFTLNAQTSSGTVTAGDASAVTGAVSNLTVTIIPGN